MSVAVGLGLACPRCGQRGERWEHEPGWTPDRGKTWYDYWHVCTNPSCVTKMYGPHAFNGALDDLDALPDPDLGETAIDLLFNEIMDNL